MEKIGIVAVTYKDNFGSALQTYATQYTLEKLGYECSIFEIKGIHKQIKLKKIFFYASRIFQQDELKYIIENFKSRTRKTVTSPSDKYAENMVIRHEKFVDFNNNRFHMMETQNSWAGLKMQAAKKKCVVVGSDQLWRPSNIAGRYYTLEFVPDNVKKIACATSFGVSKLPKCQLKHAKFFLNRIEYISVREDTGNKIIKKITGRDIPVVCDPTMLLDAKSWMQIQQKTPIAKGNYILCYFMGDNPEHREFAKKLKKKTGYRIIGLLHGATYIQSDENFADEMPYDIGPAEFINLIRNAEYICTDSFHGTVFSILNNRKFFSFRRYRDTSEFSTNDRLYTLLNWTGLSDRMLCGNEDVDECIAKKIDFETVLVKVADKRKKLIDYLICSLNS